MFFCCFRFVFKWVFFWINICFLLIHEIIHETWPLILSTFTAVHINTRAPSLGLFFTPILGMTGILFIDHFIQPHAEFC